MAGKGGLERSHASSRPQTVVFWALHCAIILLCTWLVLGGGIDRLAGWFDLTPGLVDPMRAQILLACAVVYVLRHGITLFYLLNRRVDWGEALGLTAFFALFEVGLILVGSGIFRQAPIAISGLDIFALFLYLAGSFVNTASEIQRKLWKQNSSNKGHCYTGGLFAYSMHINYFGDFILFTGFAMITHRPGPYIIPLAMTVNFIFNIIPLLDRYLEKKYGDEFRDYSRKTKKLIPLIY